VSNFTKKIKKMGKQISFLLLLCWGVCNNLYSQAPAPASCDNAMLLNINENYDSLYNTKGAALTLIPAGAIWKYNDKGDDLGPNWHENGFYDSNWDEGPAELGYGNANTVTTVDYGGSSSNKNPTTYFRKEFQVDDVSALSDILIQLVRDDGAVVYINGQEVIKDNMPTGTITYNTYASQIASADENDFLEFNLGADVLQNGTNVIAVEIHQNTPGSSDLGFDLSLSTIQSAIGPTPCISNVSNAGWFKFVASTSGTMAIESDAEFNDFLTLFSGSCANLSEIACTNKDAFGFEGEKLLVSNLNAGQTYLLRVMGVDTTFGLPIGNYSITIKDDVSAPSIPINDLCSNATFLTLDAACVDGFNRNANFDGPIPTKNKRSTNDIWYAFLSPADGRVLLESNANFSDVLTIYQGSCGAPIEIACFDHGYEALLEGLQPGTTHYVQLSSSFASIEGEVCMRAVSAGATPPSNDLCFNAFQLSVDSDCFLASNEYAGIETDASSCDLDPQASIWFYFTAPPSGKIRVNTGAEFLHVLSLHQGACGNLTELACIENPYYCNAHTNFDNLIPGQTYYLQVASATTPFGHLQGDLCMQILDNPYEPVRAKFKLVLEGFYEEANQTMRTVLSNDNILPEEHPFNTVPWNYTANECVAYTPEDAVDWLYIELRDPINQDIIIDRRAAFLRNDGIVMDTNGEEGVLFYNTPNTQQYYAVIYHFSHLGVTTATPLTFPNYNTYDFTTNLSKAYGAEQQVELPDGTFALFCGDYDHNGIINGNDYNVWNSNNAAVQAYLSQNGDGNQVVNQNDYNIWFKNRSKVGSDFILF